MFHSLSQLKQKKSKQSLILIDVYCKFRAPFLESDTDQDPGLYTIECIVCKEWFQKKCERGPNISQKKSGSVLFVKKCILIEILLMITFEIPYVKYN